MSQRPTDAAEYKAQRRAEAKRRRGALSPELRAELSERICERICGLYEYKRARVIMLYRAVGSETELRALELRAERDGKYLVYPYCTGADTMIALHPAEADAWEKGRYGIYAPDPTRAEETAPESIELVICPGLAFDRTGARLGMGAGYYDRFLARCINARFILAAFSAQESEQLRTEEHDVAMHGVVTEKEYIETA